jgi:hypothetical protein
MTGEAPGRITYALSVAVATFTDAVLGLAVCGFGAVLVLAGSDATVGVEPPDLHAVPDSTGEWVLAVAAVLCLLTGAVIGSRHPAEPRPGHVTRHVP